MATSAEKRLWFSNMFGVSFSAAAQGKPASPPGGGLAEWQAARGVALGQLKALQGKIAAMKHPRGDSAIILLRAIQANLTAKPDSAQSVGELERYLDSDDIIAEAERPNGFGLKIALRQPLLAALSTLKSEFAP